MQQQEQTINYSETIKDLEKFLMVGLNELKDIEVDLAYSGHINAQLSRYGRVALIFLGAFVTTKEVANQLLGANSGINLVIFTTAGLLVAVIAGLEAAFKWENNAIELKALAGNCQNYFREATYNKQKIEILTTDGEKLKELVQTIDMVNKDLEAIYSKATALGINLVRDLEKRRKALHKAKKEALDKANKEATHEVKQ